MNIEEAIKYIKNDIEIDKDTASWFENGNMTKEQIEERIDAYETLLTAYEKEKETSHYNQSQLDIANAKLVEEKEKNKTLKNLQNDTNRLYTEMIERKNYFEKELQKLEDKIKAKIEEAEKIIKEDRKELNFGNTLRDDILQGIVYKIDFNTRLKNILESLLEKE